MSIGATPLKCTRCRHAMKGADLVERPRASKSGIRISDHVCPKCGCKSYYDLTPQVAWCWASGLIEIGDAMPPDSADGGGAIEIARGPKYALKSQVAAMARHGKGESFSQLLVPGVPEADGRAKGYALETWLVWCGKRKARDGVTFAKGFV